VSLSEHVERAKKLEEEGRRIAFEREREVGDEVFDWLEEVASVAEKLTWFFDEVAEAGKWGDLAYRIREVAEELQYDAEACIRKKRGECVVSNFTKRKMRDLDYDYWLASRRERCTWLLGVKEPYTLAAAINDLTACFHRALEKAEEHLKKWEVEGKCAWVK